MKEAGRDIRRLTELRPAPPPTSAPGRWLVAGMPDHRVQRPQQAQPAGEGDLLAHRGRWVRFRAWDLPEVAGRRLRPLKGYPDLHVPTMLRPRRRDIGRLADVSPARPPEAC